MPVIQTVAGNIATASPISDLNPIWLAVEAQLVLQSKSAGMRTLPIDSSFFVKYRQTLIRPDEVIMALKIPLLSEVCARAR
jgi:xanthine dehydrogenase/oxidase